MTTHGRPEITPDIVQDFATYLHAHPTWGSLRIVLDDGNYETSHVKWCVEHAREKNDPFGERLGEILLSYTKSQRARIIHKVNDLLAYQQALAS